MNFFIDLDGTLKTDREHVGGEILSLGGKQYPYILRPHAKEFIEELAKIGKVFICTAATKRYGETFAKLLDIDNLISGVYGRENMRNVNQADIHEFIIVDNDRKMAEEKIFVMEGGHMLFNKKHIIDIPTFRGDMNCTALLFVLGKCKEIMDKA